MNKKLVYGIVGVIAILLAWFTGSALSGGNPSIKGVSTASTTNSTRRISSITIAPSSGTTTSLLNSDATDRVITSTDVICTGVGTSQTFSTGAGLASWTLQSSTGTQPGLGLFGNNNFSSNFTIGTSTSFAFIASSTDPFPNIVARLWPSGVYNNFVFNATNTAACTINVNYLSL